MRNFVKNVGNSQNVTIKSINYHAICLLLYQLHINFARYFFFIQKNLTMKRLFFAASLLLSSHFIFAQINQGQWLVGGNASFQSSKYGDVDASKVTNLTFSPNAGYFFINNLAGGLRLTIESEKFKEADDATSSFLFAPFVRYYFLPAANKVNVFGDASYGFGSMKDGESESFNQFTISAGPAIFLSPNAALEFALQYASAGGDAIGDDRYNSFGVNVGFQIHLGNASK
jgi:hypothetical protein